MGAGIGFARDAQKSFEQNRQMRQHKAPFQRMSENNFINPPELKFKEISPEELEKFRTAFLKKKRA
jgi:hypothetical protein